MCQGEQVVSSSAAKATTTMAPPTTEEEKDSLKSATTTERQQLGKLIFCASGICACYLYYGYLQERLLTTSPSKNKLGPSFVLWTQCVTNVVVAWLWRRVLLQLQAQQQQTSSHDGIKKIQQHPPSLPHTLLWATAGCYVTAMVCSNEALRFGVPYPVQVLAKSCKLIPTMLVGQLVEGRQRVLYGPTEWAAALCISLGILLFFVQPLPGPVTAADHALPAQCGVRPPCHLRRTRP